MESKSALSEQFPLAPTRLKHIWWDGFLTRRVQLALDAGVFLLAIFIAYLLRFDFIIPPEWRLPILLQCPLIVGIQFISLNLAGGHRFIWRYTSLSHLRLFYTAAGVSFACCVILRLTLPDLLSYWRVPLSVAIIDNLFAFGGVLGVRVLRRTFHESVEATKQQRLGKTDGAQIPVILIGAGQMGVFTLREMKRQGGFGLTVKGFVDDDPSKQNLGVIHGVKVLGKISELPKLVKELQIDHVIITIALAAPHDLQRILNICRSIPIQVRIIPGWAEVIQGKFGLNQIRDVQIEDLLGREQVELDSVSISQFLAGRVVMVTGAGGSIGSELARQVARFEPSHLLLVERAEPALFNVERELAELFPTTSIFPLIADTGDEQRMRAVFAQHRPDVILHAAAHKHVPLMEQNPGEAIKNNALSTKIIGEMAAEFEAKVFVLVSTDKAVRPTSIMGASKRLAELIILDLNHKHKNTRFAAVRFGNVIGSAGSVIPIFQEQIRKGGPVKITDRRMTRYFMTIPEAAQLVLQAGAIDGRGGEVYILRMGEPVKIIELAENLIILSGFRPNEEIKILETGIRPGEKLFEELVISGEVAETSHPKILINRIVGPQSENMHLYLQNLTQAAQKCDGLEVRRTLSELIPEAQLSVTTETNVPNFEKVTVAKATQFIS